MFHTDNTNMHVRYLYIPTENKSDGLVSKCELDCAYLSCIWSPCIMSGL